MSAPGTLAVLPTGLVALVDRASAALAAARTSAEVLEARDMASLAYDVAKKAARLAKAKGAHDELIAVAHRAQADALEIEAGAKRRLADEYDAAQERGEVAKLGTNQTQVGVSGENTLPTAADIGLTRGQVHDARLVRDAMVADPGIIRRVLDEALERGDEPSKAIVREAMLATNAIATKQKAERVERRRREIAAQAAALGGFRPTHELFHAPCLSALDGPAGFADFVVTDPPYPREFLPFYDDLGRVAAHVLKPGGSLLCMTGQSYLPQVIEALGRHLTYHWQLAYLTPGQSTKIFDRRLNTGFKPVLWYTKNEFGGWLSDDVARSDLNDKRFHRWGQSESGFADLMQRFVTAGHTVVDPFMGGGTTGVVALALGARFIGYDVDQDAFNEASVRLDRAAAELAEAAA